MCNGFYVNDINASLNGFLLMILIPLDYLDRLSTADRKTDEDNADQANRSPICTGFCKIGLYIKIDLRWYSQRRHDWPFD